MHPSTPLDNITIVLMDTKTPANIGSAARAMMNMGLANLVLVNPPDDPDREAVKLAAGADALLERARIVSTLADAIGDYGLAIGTSRHAGKQRKNIRTPREMAEQVMPLLGSNRVAIVFGNEVNGLDNDALSRCQEIVAIPSSDDFASLNLSHAVMIIAYELYQAAQKELPPSTIELAPLRELENFFLHLEGTLQNIGFLEQAHPKRMMFGFRQMFGRARLTRHDVSVLRGVLTSIEQSARKSSDPPETLKNT